MVTIIRFPTPNERVRNNAIAVIQSRLVAAGLTDDQIQRTLAELEHTLAPLFQPISAELEIPEELNLTPIQLAGVNDAVVRFHDALSTAQSKTLAYAANAIAGLTARSVIDSDQS